MADQDSLRTMLTKIRAPELSYEDRQKELTALLPTLTAQVRAKEEVLLSRALELDEVRVQSMTALEEHELAEIMADRARQSAHGDQLLARVQVLSDLLEQHMSRSERELYPQLRSRLSVAEREEMGMRYREAKDRNELAPVFEMPVRKSLLESQTGRIGYVIAWLLGVPVWVLLMA